ncbi:universal stress protein [Streptomyces sp. NPDC001292]|uniref:universal stress protein n=1 Tax=Streptomyces sp. NPDC001292 TaxID=3364558 RepID=UPI003688CE4D
MFKRILVAVDASPARFATVRMAGELARLTSAEVVVVHVVPSAVRWDTVVQLEEGGDGQEVIDEAVAALREAEVKASGDLRFGMTFEVPGLIADAARDVGADLLMISPQHRGAVAAFFDPRVSDAVAHASRIAVLFTPDGERQPAPGG